MSGPLGPRVVRSRVGRESGGETLLDVLAGRFTYHSREAWTAILAVGQVTLDGQPATATTPLVAGSMLEYHCGDLPEPPVPRDLQVVYEDEELLVVAKPPGLPVHPAGHYFAHTLWAMLHEQGYESLHFLSRLDRETSGLLLAAKTSEAAAHYQRLAAAGRITKTYLVAVEGEFPETLDACGWLFPDPDSVIRKKRRFAVAQPATGEAQTAETHCRRLASHAGLSPVQAGLVTGRTHQIRATLCSLGYPVVGDKIYGRDETWFLRFRDGQLTPTDETGLRLPHQALHAWKLAIQLPSGENMAWTCPPPTDLVALFPDQPR